MMMLWFFGISGVLLLFALVVAAFSRDGSSYRARSESTRDTDGGAAVAWMAVSTTTMASSTGVDAGSCSVDGGGGGGGGDC